MSDSSTELQLVTLVVPMPLELVSALWKLLAAALAPASVAYMRGGLGDVPLVCVDAPADAVMAALDAATARIEEKP